MNEEEAAEARRQRFAGAAWVENGIAWIDCYRYEAERIEVGPEKERFYWSCTEGIGSSHRVHPMRWGSVDAEAMLERDGPEQPFTLTYRGRVMVNTEVLTFEELQRHRSLVTHEYQLKGGTTMEALKEACGVVAAHETQHFRDQAMKRFRPDPVEMKRDLGYER